MWTFSNIFLMLLTEIAPQAVLKLRKVKLFAMWSERGIKNTILLNGIYLVLSELFIQLRSSQNDRGVNASEVTTSCQYQSWSLTEFKHLPFLLSQHKMRFLFFLHFKSHGTQQNICQACKNRACQHLSAISFPLSSIMSDLSIFA